VVSSPKLGMRLARTLIFAIDTIQRRRHRVYEFESDPHCIFRISRCQSPQDRVLSDGTIIHRGDPILEFHFWNERVPRMGPEGPDLTWGLRFCHDFRYSLRALADYIRNRPDMDDIVAIRGESSFPSTMGWQRYIDLCNRLGFDFSPLPSTAPAERLASFFTHLYVWIMIWALSPASLKGRSVIRAERCELWLSCDALLRRYGTETAQRRAQHLGPTLPSAEPSSHQEEMALPNGAGEDSARPSRSGLLASLFRTRAQ